MQVCLTIKNKNMKRILYFVIAVLFLSLMPEISFAQSNDPLDNARLKAT